MRPILHIVRSGHAPLPGAVLENDTTIELPATPAEIKPTSTDVDAGPWREIVDLIFRADGVVLW